MISLIFYNCTAMKYIQVVDSFISFQIIRVREKSYIFDFWMTFNTVSTEVLAAGWKLNVKNIYKKRKCQCKFRYMGINLSLSLSLPHTHTLLFLTPLLNKMKRFCYWSIFRAWEGLPSLWFSCETTFILLPQVVESGKIMFNSCHFLRWCYLWVHYIGLYILQKKWTLKSHITY